MSDTGGQQASSERQPGRRKRAVHYSDLRQCVAWHGGSWIPCLGYYITCYINLRSFLRFRSWRASFCLFDKKVQGDFTASARQKSLFGVLEGGFLHQPGILRRWRPAYISTIEAKRRMSYRVKQGSCVVFDICCPPCTQQAMHGPPVCLRAHESRHIL